MPVINFVEFDGTRRRVEVAEGENVMRGALYNDVPGIVGECGGACSCATCHCYIDPAWAAAVGGPQSTQEKDLLEGTASEVRPDSRLSCQVVVTSDLDGLMVHLPERQF